MTHKDSQGAEQLSARESENDQTMTNQHKTYSLDVLLAEDLPLWKRGLDILGAALFLIALSPLFLMIAAVIKLSSSGPVLYAQERIGYLGKPFKLWKFRTMRYRADESVHSQYLQELIEQEKPLEKLDALHDPRITPVGNFLRQTCLDELPQLLNVLQGNMSLVGPRPCLAYEMRNYAQWQTRRFDAVPGLTGLWQVSGKNRTTFKEMIRLDIQYKLRRSLTFDLRILFRTIPFLISQLKLGVTEFFARGDKHVERG